MTNIRDYTLWEWFKRLVSGKPHIRIHPGEYIDRWHLIPRNNTFNIYLHKYYGGDRGRAPHDHPWWNKTIVLKGGFIEYTYFHSDTGHFERETHFRLRGDVIHRKAEDIHRIELPDGMRGRTWTLFITGAKTRKWGFWEDDGDTFVEWEEYEAKHGLQDYVGKQKP